ncbi:Ino80 chromatin remodeling complex [Teratosphaeria destructans]|uniref:Ino80 chromatin remodeling complex n=1 Tax=Teratosphaeria destructans TaxID=418781 RepID=A0A9W7SRG8_9PEZI|nr:Ino80 chromatin remodeling complex [Teratosphaeria destructans]
MASLQHILAGDPGDSSSAAAHTSSAPVQAPPATVAELKAAMPPPSSLPRKEHSDEQSAANPKAAHDTADDESLHTSTTTTTRRNPSGSVSSVYSGNKIKHLKKEDGIPLWRKDIQFDFLKLVFYDKTRCFTKFSDRTGGHTFAEVYVDAMAKSSKCSKILKEKLLQDTEGAISMAMVCLLVNVGRMNTTLNCMCSQLVDMLQKTLTVILVFPEMRAQLRTYHSIPALQAGQDPSAYKQLQDAPRLKSILKGATEDEPQPSTLEEVKAASRPRTNPVNLIFVMSQYAPKVSESHFNPPRDFFDLVMRGSLSSTSRARAFLWLLWWYLESDFGYEDSQRNPFGAGERGEGDESPDAIPMKVPALESLTEEQAALENVDTEEEILFGEVKRKERIAILASEPSPAMTALKRARKEKGLMGRGEQPSDDETNEGGWPKGSVTSAPRLPGMPDYGSEHTRSPSPAARGFQAVNAPKAAPDMRINNLLNDDVVEVPSPPTVKKGPGRGNWRRNKQKQDGAGPLAARAAEAPHHVPLLPNNGQYSFNVNDSPSAAMQPATPGASAYPSQISPQVGNTISFATNFRDHIPTPSYQAQKRHRGVTQHQSAIISHRRQQIEYTLDRRIRRVHAAARDDRDAEGSILRAWKRLKRLPPDYDSEEERIRIDKAKSRAEKDDDFRVHRGKENTDVLDDLELIRKPKVLMGGLSRLPGEPSDVGEEVKAIAQTIRRVSRRLEKWQDTDLPGQGMLRRQTWEASQPSGSRQAESGRHAAKAAQVAVSDRIRDDEERDLLGELDAGEDEDDEDDDY